MKANFMDFGQFEIPQELPEHAEYANYQKDGFIEDFQNNPFITVFNPPIQSDSEIENAFQRIQKFNPKHRWAEKTDRFMMIDSIAHNYFSLSYHIPTYRTIYSKVFHCLNIRFYRSKLSKRIATINNDTNMPNIAHSTAGEKVVAIMASSGGGKTAYMNIMKELMGKPVKYHTHFRGLDLVIGQIIGISVVVPYNCAPAAFMNNILSAFDEQLGTNYRETYGRFKTIKPPIDEMVETIKRLAHDHWLGFIHVDEVQRLARYAGGDLEELLVRLTNKGEFTLIYTGTLDFLQILKSMKSIRRVIGNEKIIWDRLAFNSPDWRVIIRGTFQKQYNRNPIYISPSNDGNDPYIEKELDTVFYVYTQGIPDLIITLFMMSLKRAIEIGEKHGKNECLTAEIVQAVAVEHFELLLPSLLKMARRDASAEAEYEKARIEYDEHIRIMQPFGPPLIPDDVSINILTGKVTIGEKEKKGSRIDPKINLDDQSEEGSSNMQTEIKASDDESSRINRLKSQGGGYAEQLDKYTLDSPSKGAQIDFEDSK